MSFQKAAVHPSSSRSACVDLWQRAYEEFETPEQERTKFERRLRALGVDTWDRDVLVTELFCGRGNALYAWEAFGFQRLEGLDFSAALAAQYRGAAQIYVGDARALPWPNLSRSVISIQGGLHHLSLMRDLERTLGEIHRVLEPSGRLILVEPWPTPFLSTVHAACRVPLFRRRWRKLDALATMIELERSTYEDWLRRPRQILSAIEHLFEPSFLRVAWGKLTLVADKKQVSGS